MLSLPGFAEGYAGGSSKQGAKANYFRQFRKYANPQYRLCFSTGGQAKPGAGVTSAIAVSAVTTNILGREYRWPIRAASLRTGCAAS